MATQVGDGIWPCRNAIAASLLPPDDLLGFLVGVELGMGGVPDLGAVILPAGVGENADDLAALDAPGEAQRAVEHRAGGEAGKDALAVHDTHGMLERLRRTDQQLAVEHPRVEDRRDV